jgi:hypothetical protein
MGAKIIENLFKNLDKRIKVYDNITKGVFMKNTNLSSLPVLILLLLVCLEGCISNPTINTEGKSFPPNELCFEYMYTDIPITQYSYLALKENLHFMELDGVHGSGDRAVIIPSGGHIITVKYSVGNQYTDPMLIRFNFEPGKYYYLDYEYKEGEFFKADQIEPFVSDMPETLIDDAKNKFEKVRLFLEWSIANPTTLDAAWIKEDGKSFISKITITGNEFKITMPLGFYVGNVEGKLFFDQNWIVLYPTRHYSTRNKNNEEFNAPFSFQPAWLNKETFYYERNGDYLSITKTIANSNYIQNKNSVRFKKME